MNKSVKGMIISVKEGADNIDIQSESLSAVSEEMSASSENVTNSIQEIAKGTGSQAESLVDVVEKLNNFGYEIEAIV
jgi:methyl-accepting chemotaxis protein